MTWLGSTGRRRHDPLSIGVFALILALLIVIGLAAELRRYVGPDIGFLLDAAGRVLDGDRLYVDVLEINPPLIIALNAPAVWLARTLDLSDILVYRLGFTAVLLGLLWLSAWLLRDHLPDQAGPRRALLLVLAFVLFLMASTDYGEREHLVLALLVPYLLLTASRIKGQEVTRARGLCLGVLAGLAFALKPHFLLLWALVEVVLRATRRVAARAVLPETLGIAGLIVAYLVMIAILTPEYFTAVRLLAGSYSRFLYDPFWRLLVTGPGALLALFALLSFAALRRYARHPALWQAIALAVCGGLLAGAAQQKGLRYHFYPAFGLATLMLGLIAVDCAPVLGDRLRRVYRSLAVGVLSAFGAVVMLEQVATIAKGPADPTRAQFEDLVRLVRARAENEGVFVMSYHLRSGYPLVNYSGARSGSSFPHLWILAAEYLEALKSDAPLRYRRPDEMSPTERYMNLTVLEDLRRRPKLLLVFRPARDLPTNGYRRLDYIAYFSRHPAIARILGEYELVARTGDYLIYQWIQPGARRTGLPPMITPASADIVPAPEAGARLRFGDPRPLVAFLSFLLGLAAVRRSASGEVSGQ